MTSKHSLITRRAWLGALLCALALLASVAPAGAQTTQSRLDAARKEASQFRSRAQQLADALIAAQHEKQEATANRDETEYRINRSRDKIAELQDALKDRVRAAYRMRGVGFFQFLLEAQSFREFNVRLMNLQRQTLADEDLILDLRRERHELELRKQELQAQEAVLTSRINDVEAQTRQVTVSLAEANRIVSRLKGVLSREQVARLFRIGGPSTGGLSVPMKHCPVSGPHSFSNDWGAPRGGGTRRHQGNDIMAPMGTPLVAVVDGRITRTGNGGLGGTTLYLFGEGNEYYYAHNQRNVAGAGQSVRAGQVIAYVGNTGNARGGAPHVHFELHPGGGGAVNPYPSLTQVC